jgi:putative ABC transport system ATP-binding protein
MSKGASGAMLQVENLTKVYRRGDEQVHALDNLTLSVADGEFVAVLGPSGSGKSTFMNLVGLLDQPTSGQILFGGRPTDRLGRREREALRRKTIGFVFQQFLLIPTMTALENVMLPCYFAGEKNAASRATELLERVGLGKRLHHLPKHMSGGEIQRVAIARALANDPAIILADEPTGNLDSATAEGVISLFKEINRAGKTVVVVTHNNDLAARLPRAITLRDGRLVSDVKQGKVDA